MSVIQPRLQYNYAQIELPSGKCTSTFTSSYQIPLPEYIEIPIFIGDYMDKYYNFYGDQLWYWDAEFTQLWEECPSH